MYFLIIINVQNNMSYLYTVLQGISVRVSYIQYYIHRGFHVLCTVCFTKLTGKVYYDNIHIYDVCINKHRIVYAVRAPGPFLLDTSRTCSNLHA